jgi:putative ubiquitin-RnfH superfamily antitoxin RatB of RatAB toxin-antitoxin module
MNKIRVLVASAASERQQEIEAELPSGTTLERGTELLASEIAALLNGEPAAAIGVWGKVRAPHYVLREGDRIELYRALSADPKQARRMRAEGKNKRA